MSKNRTLTEAVIDNLNHIISGHKEYIKALESLCIKHKIDFTAIRDKWLKGKTNDHK